MRPSSTSPRGRSSPCVRPFRLATPTPGCRTARPLALLLQGARKGGLAIVPEVDRGQLTLQYGGLPSFWAFNYNVYRETYGEEIAKQLHHHPMLNAGVFALHRDAPHWSAWREGLESALQRSVSLYVDQVVLNAVVYRQLFAQTELLPAWCNWAWHHGQPAWDRRQQRCRSGGPPPRVSLISTRKTTP
jgi:hypothetical protein